MLTFFKGAIVWRKYKKNLKKKYENFKKNNKNCKESLRKIKKK